MSAPLNASHRRASSLRIQRKKIDAPVLFTCWGFRPVLVPGSSWGVGWGEMSTSINWIARSKSVTPVPDEAVITYLRAGESASVWASWCWLGDRAPKSAVRLHI